MQLRPCTLEGGENVHGTCNGAEAFGAACSRCCARRRKPNRLLVRKGRSRHLGPVQEKWTSRQACAELLWLACLGCRLSSRFVLNLGFTWACEKS